MNTELTEAERAAEQVLTDNIPHIVGLVGDAIARQIVAAVRPVIARETLCEEAAYMREHRRDDNGAFDMWKMYEAGGPEWLANRAAHHRHNP
jgi:hypothetical protein